MNENEHVQDDEINLFDLWQKLRVGWRYVLGGAVTGVFCAGLAIALIPPKFVAIAVIQIGQIGQIGQNEKNEKNEKIKQNTSIPVESAARVIERMKTPAFQRKAADAAGDQKWVDDLLNSNFGVTKDLSLQLIKGTDGSGQTSLIELRVNGETAELARRKTEASVAQLVKTHEELSSSTILKMRGDLALNREKLENAEKDIDGLNKLVAAANARGDRFPLITSLRLFKEADLYSLRQMIMALETALSVPATQPTKALEAVFVSNKPASPKKGLLLGVGSIGGLLVGMMVVFVIDAWRRGKNASKGRRFC